MNNDELTLDKLENVKGGYHPDAKEDMKKIFDEIIKKVESEELTQDLLDKVLA